MQKFQHQPRKDFKNEINSESFDARKSKLEKSLLSLGQNDRIISSLWILSLCEQFSSTILPIVLLGVTDKNLRFVMCRMLDAPDRLDIQSTMKPFVIKSGLPVNQLSIRRSIFLAFNDLKKVKRPIYLKPEWDKICSHAYVNIPEKYKVKQRKKIGWKYAVSSQTLKHGICFWKIKYVKSSGQGSDLVAITGAYQRKLGYNSLPLIPDKTEMIRQLV